MNQIQKYFVRSAKKLENIIFLAVILFVLKILFDIRPTSAYIVLNEIIVFLLIASITIYIADFVKIRIINPIPIIINMGIFSAIIFFFSSVSTKFSEAQIFNSIEKDLLKDLITIFVAYMVIFSLSYIFATLKELYYLRQKKDNSSVFNTMLIFMVISSLANTIAVYEPSLKYVKNAFCVVTIILISINSIKVTWIAFLTKKQKLNLLFLSIIIFTVFIFNSVFSLDSLLAKELELFSPAVEFFLQLTMLYGAIYFGVIFFTALFHLPTAEAFDRKVEEISSLMDLSNLMTQVLILKN